MKYYISLFFFIIICGTSSAQLFTSSYQGSNFLTKNLNNALDFDGVNDCVITTLDVNYSALPITTWEAWVFPTTNDGGWRTVFGIEDGGWDRNVFTNGGSFFAGFGNGGWQITTYNINEWQHIAVVYNEASGSMKFYKNGVAFTYSNSIGIPVSAQKFAIGSSQQVGPNQFFQGKISEVRVWNYERTQAQIQGSMNTELTGEETGLVAYYPFNGNANDASVNGNNGTVNGATLDVDRFGNQRTIYFDSEFMVDRVETIDGKEFVIGIPVSLKDKGYEAKIAPIKIEEIYFTPKK